MLSPQLTPDKAGSGESLPRGAGSDSSRPEGDAPDESARRQSEKMRAISQLAGGVAHDLNNSLMAIRGYVELCARELQNVEQTPRSVLEMLQQVERSTDRAAALVRKLLAFGRRQVTQPRTLDLNLVLRGLERSLHELLPEEVAFELRLGPDLGAVCVDPAEIEQVLVNLIGNARDALDGEGRVVVATRSSLVDEAATAAHAQARPGPHVVLEVVDTGRGIEPDDLERVFEPFFTTKADAGGIGLGLSTVYGIVERSGGFVEVESRPGQGATFSAYLPVVDEASPLSSAKGAAAGAQGSETILLCDHDLTVLELAGAVLRDAGYDVLVAANGLQALAVASRHADRVRLLVSDLEMSGLGGTELFRTLSVSIPDLKGLFVSGRGGAHPPASSEELAAGRRVLLKPFRAGTLLRRVREVLDS